MFSDSSHYSVKLTIIFAERGENFSLLLYFILSERVSYMPTHALIFLYSGCAIIISAFLLLYGFCKKHTRAGFDLIAKCGGSFTCAFAAAVSIASKAENPFTSFIFGGLILCCAADALLEIKFQAGVSAFGLAHILFIIFMLFNGGFSAPTIILWLALYVIILAVFNKHIFASHENKLILFSYPALLLFMASLAIGLVINNGFSYIIFAVGAVLFAFSDFLVAMDHFGRRSKYSGAIIMISYYLALFLFSAGTLLI